jgi:hypothetical protein
MALSAAQLFLARDRVKDVLETYLESSIALERANNIVQALAFEDDDPVDVAGEMLKNQKIDNINAVILRVAEAWRQVNTELQSEATPQETAGSDPDVKKSNTRRRYSEVREIDITTTKSRNKRARSI